MLSISPVTQQKPDSLINFYVSTLSSIEENFCEIWHEIENKILQHRFRIDAQFYAEENCFYNFMLSFLIENFLKVAPKNAERCLHYTECDVL